MDPKRWMTFFNRLMDEAGDGDGGGAGSGAGDGNKGSGTGGGDTTAALLAEIKAMREELKTLKAGGKAGEPDPALEAIQKKKQTQEQTRATQERIVAATKFNVGLETFLKEYAGVLPPDANEIPKVSGAEEYPDEVERSSALKASLIESFFKEEPNQKLLSESQLAKLKTWRSLGLAARREQASHIYEVVFEPAINHARSIRQAQIRAKEDTFRGSKDSDIIMRKVHEKILRQIGHNYKFNDVLHAQAKELGIVSQQS